MSEQKQWIKVGSLNTNLPGKKDKYYIKVANDVVLKKGQYLQVRDPRTSFEAAVANGKMSEEKAAELVAGVPDFVKFEIVLPPPKDA